MDNPFEGLKYEPDFETRAAGFVQERQLLEEKRRQKRDMLYNVYSPMVSEVLDQLIAAWRPGIWKRDSACENLFCCHIRWFAGPEEKFHDPYVEHHAVRRIIEVELEQNADCDPFGFKITNHEALNRIIHVGLTRDELIRGLKEAFTLPVAIHPVAA
jgi:hypothetical protein